MLNKGPSSTINSPIPAKSHGIHEPPLAYQLFTHVLLIKVWLVENFQSTRDMDSHCIRFTLVMCDSQHNTSLV